MEVYVKFMTRAAVPRSRAVTGLQTRALLALCSTGLTVIMTDLCDARVSCVGLVTGRASQYIQAQGQGRFQNLPSTLEGL